MGTVDQVSLNPGVHLELHQSAILNNSVVNYTDISTSGTRSLSCVTERVDCCSADNGTRAEWFDPSGSEVADTQFLRIRTGLGDPNGYIHLFRKLGARDVLDGLYHCNIPSSNGDISTLYVGIYRSNARNIGE